MQVDVTAAHELHAPQIAAIWETGWHEAHDGLVPDALRRLRSSESFVSRCASHLPHTRIAVNTDGAVIGFCMVVKDELYQMYLSAPARGTGAAQRLIADAEARIALAGYDRGWLACAIGNARAARFYEKSGWNNCGPRSVQLETQEGLFKLKIWRFEKILPARIRIVKE